MQISKVHFKCHSSPFFSPLLPERGPHIQVQRTAKKENVWFHKKFETTRVADFITSSQIIQTTQKYQDTHSHWFIYQ